jgi:hypothetical protein
MRQDRHSPPIALPCRSNRLQIGERCLKIVHPEPIPSSLSAKQPEHEEIGCDGAGNEEPTPLPTQIGPQTGRLTSGLHAGILDGLSGAE